MRVKSTRLAALIAAGLAATAATAVATNFGAGGGIYYTDNNIVTFHYALLDGVFADSTNWVRINELEPTRLVTGTGTTTEESAADVSVFDANYGDSGWWGVAECMVLQSATICEHHHVRINRFHSPGGDGWSATERRSILCEEIGHTLGLRHRDASGTCMSQRWNETHFNSHDDDHINARY
jgi:hypothetical protein